MANANSIGLTTVCHITSFLRRGDVEQVIDAHPDYRKLLAAQCAHLQPSVLLTALERHMEILTKRDIPLLDKLDHANPAWAKWIRDCNQQLNMCTMFTGMFQEYIEYIMRTIIRHHPRTLPSMCNWLKRFPNQTLRGDGHDHTTFSYALTHRVPADYIRTMIDAGISIKEAYGIQRIGRIICASGDSEYFYDILNHMVDCHRHHQHRQQLHDYEALHVIPNSGDESCRKYVELVHKIMLCQAPAPKAVAALLANVLRISPYNTQAFGQLLDRYESHIDGTFLLERMLSHGISHIPAFEMVAERTQLFYAETLLDSHLPFPAIRCENDSNGARITDVMIKHRRWSPKGMDAVYEYAFDYQFFDAKMFNLLHATFPCRDEDPILACLRTKTRSSSKVVSIPLLEFLLDHYPLRSDAGCVWVALIAHPVNVLEMLLSRGANPNALSCYIDHCGHDRENVPVIARYFNTCRDDEVFDAKVDALIQHGADPNYHGATAAAICLNNIRQILYFLDKYKDRIKWDQTASGWRYGTYGNTILSRFCESYPERVMPLIAKYPAMMDTINTVSETGRPPAMILFDKYAHCHNLSTGHMMQFLALPGLDINQMHRCHNGDGNVVVQMLLHAAESNMVAKYIWNNPAVDWRCTDMDGKNLAYLMAAQLFHIKTENLDNVLVRFVEAIRRIHRASPGTNINYVFQSGNPRKFGSLLHALNRGWSTRNSTIVHRLMAEFPEADFDLADSKGITPLMLALLDCNLDEVRELSKVANINYYYAPKPSMFESPLTFAIRAVSSGSTYTQTMNILKHILQDPRLDINITSRDKRSAMYFLLTQRRGQMRLRILELVLSIQHTIDFGAMTPKHKPLREVAASDQMVVRMIAKYERTQQARRATEGQAQAEGQVHKRSRIA